MDKICPECNGKGYEENHRNPEMSPLVCVICGGTGKVSKVTVVTTKFYRDGKLVDEVKRYH